MSILFKGRGTKNEGDLYFIDHNKESVISINDDVNDAKVKKALEKAAKRKHKVKESIPHFATLSPYKDWFGNPVFSDLDGQRVQKYNVKCLFKVYETKIFVLNKKKLEREKY